MDNYTQAKAEENAAFLHLDIDIDKIVPPRAFQEIPGEETVSPDGIRMLVTRVTKYHCGIVVAGNVIGLQHSKRDGSAHCFIYRFVPFPQ